ncbi:MAG TPA: glycoside hydrolase family 38 C-terminal domain-containing protein [Planctomycetota bacterium]|nr:glycoside hydrolase family 38 C-terminal domain-containing protein [Planctomycetota bacterium]
MSDMDLKQFTVHMIANAHIDPAWLWQWKEGRDEVFNTYRSALNLMAEFPQLAFSCSAACTYEWVEQGDRAMFDEIRRRVAEGRWEIVNGWWVQPDCNIPSGESYIRHSLYGKSYFLDKFSVDVKTGYNVDTFGHCSALPKILKQAGFEHYVFFRPGPHEKTLPGSLFWWESDDGSRVLALRAPHHYGTWGDVNMAERISTACSQWQAPTSHVACFFGVGNHGGGPTREQIRRIIEVQQMPGMPQVRFSTLEQFFAESLAQSQDYPVVNEDLQHHAVGCYSAVSQVKRQNREAEALLLSAERFGACAAMLGQQKDTRPAISGAWKKVLFNQFHDILAGSSIKPVYDDATEDYDAADRAAKTVLNDSLEKIGGQMETAGEGQPFLVFNPLPWQRTDAVTAELLLPDSPAPFKVIDPAGNALPVQVLDQVDQAGRCRTKVCFAATLPALGCSVFRLVTGAAAEFSSSLHAYGSTLENNRCKLIADPTTGHIVSLFDKARGVECIAGPACVPIVIDDPSDTWSHDIVEFRNEIGRFAGPTQLVECGPVRATLRTRQTWGASSIEQDYTLYNGLDRIDCEMRIDWHERHKMLKLAVPVNAAEPQATFEVPLGTIVRPPLGHEEPGLRWADLAWTAGGQTTGLTIANDSKYGYDFKGKELRVSILRSPIYAFHDPRVPEASKKYLYTDQGTQTVRYSLRPHAGDWREAGAPRQGCTLNSPFIVLTDVKPHAGRLGRSVAFISVSPDNVIAEVLKAAEDGNGMIVRVHETAGRDTTAKLDWPAAPAGGTSHSFTIGHNQIKTFRVAGGAVAEVSLLER